VYTKRLNLPIILIIFSIILFIGSLNIPKSPLGNPDAPMYFPLLISIALFVLSVIYLIQEWKKRHENLGILNKLRAGRTPRLIIGTLVLCIIYTLLFERIGFLVSGMLFLGAELSLVNGYKKWITNGLVSILFTLLVWYGFSKLLGINLP